MVFVCEDIDDCVSLQQIDTYETIYHEVEEVDGTVTFEKWFRVDVRPFRQALLNIIKKWSLMFKQHLIDHVTNRSVLNLTKLVTSSRQLIRRIENDWCWFYSCLGLSSIEHALHDMCSRAHWEFP
jgi:hypothetical protein